MREDQTTSKPTWTWTAWLTALCAGIVLYAFLHPRGNASNIAYLIGYNLPIGLIFWGIFQLIAGRKLGRRCGIAAFLSIWCTLVVGSVVGSAQQREREQAVQAVSEIQNNFTALASKSGASAGTIPRNESVIRSESTSGGQFYEMTRYISDIMMKADALHKSYKAALRQIGWNTILDPSRLGHDTNFVESKGMLRQASDIVQKYHHENGMLLVTERTDINNLDISSNVKDAMRRGFDKNAEMGSQQIDAAWAIQSRIVSTVGEIISLLDNKRAVWRVEGKHVIFSNKTDLNAFNSYLSRIHELAVEERTMHDKNVKLVGNNLERLRDQISR